MYSAGRGAPVNQAGGTIGTSLERIGAAIQALHDQVRNREEQGFRDQAGAEAGMRVLLERHLHDMAVLSRNPTLPASSNETQALAVESVRMRFKFITDGENSGVCIAPYDQTKPTTGRAYFPWEDTLERFPLSQCGTMLADPDDEDAKLEHACTFSPGFQQPPTVTCWLTGFDALESPYRVRVRATDITERGFKMHIEPASARGVSVAWIAGIPASQVGVFNIHGSGMWGVRPFLSHGAIATGYKGDRRLAIAITQVDIGGVPVFPVRVGVKVVRESEHFKWVLNAGVGDLGIYQMKGVYIYI